MANLQVDDLPLIPAVDNADMYAAKSNLDYRVRTGEANGIATLDGSGKVPAGQLPTLNFLPLTGGTLTGPLIGTTASFDSVSSNGALAYFATTGAGTIHLRPNGVGSATGQTTINSAGVLTTGGSLIATGNVTANGGAMVATNGQFIGGANTFVATSVPGVILFRPNGIGSATGEASISAVGLFTSTGGITSSNNVYNGGPTFAVFGPSGPAGQILFRPNGTGSTTGQMIVDVTGAAVPGTLTAGTVLSTGGEFRGAASSVVLNPSSAGTIFLRPNGAASSAGETTITTSGVVAINGNMSAFQVTSGGGNFVGAANVILASGGSGNIFLRPNGAASATSEFSINSSGTVTSNGVGAGYTFVDRTSGRNWLMYGTGDVWRWFNGVSGIMDLTATGNLSATNFTATSDLRLKNVTGTVAPRDFSALDIIEWTWKDNGEYGIGIGAQSVKAVAHEYVHENKEGTLSVDKAGLALEWVASLEKKIKMLEVRLRDLEERCGL